VSRALTRVVSWGHELIAEKVSKGQLVVDLTAGNGYDVLMLSRLVGMSGQVIAFDIQSDALKNSQQRLLADGATVRLWTDTDSVIPSAAGVDLVEAGHENLQRYLPGPPQGVIANLGYLPGGDRQIISQPQTTVQALRQSCELLAPGGRLAVVVYPGHPGGSAEGAAVESFFSGLDESGFQVLQLKVANRSAAPYLLVAERK
jgi:predicted methyltransferase